ncbi:hypothetical protein FALCPG4_014684 [Fusarium falciforme]
MGCIILEFIIWMMNGIERVKDFQAELNGRLHDSAYWEEARSKELSVDRKEAEVAALVKKEMDKISQDTRCGKSPDKTALCGLLELVRTRLLVVPLPPGLGHMDMGDEEEHHEGIAFRQLQGIGTAEGYDTDAPEEYGEGETPAIIVTTDEKKEAGSPGKATSKEADETKVYRARASDLQEALQKIKSRGDADENYWCTGKLSVVQAPLTVTPRHPEAKAGDSSYVSWASAITAAADSGTAFSTSTTSGGNFDRHQSGTLAPRDQRNLVSPENQYESE